MNQEEQSYLQLLKEIIDTNQYKGDRTGIGTYSMFGSKLKFSLRNNTIPLLTTKKVFFKGVVEELLFFLRGDTDTKKLEEKGVNIWKGNTSRDFLDKHGLKSLPEGDMGLGYGFQWRDFGTSDGQGFDQIADVIDKLKNSPNDRRILFSAWNPSALHLMALPPCHILAQFYVYDNKLSCQFYMRSVDTFLGLPFNVASYAVLTHILAKATNLEANELIFVGGDTHIYKNHLEAVDTQLSRQPYEFPTLNINKSISSIQDIEKLEFTDFELKNYKCHPTIKAEMAV